MNKRVAIIHDYLTEFGGAERTLKTIHDLFPNSTVFTSSYDEKAIPEFKDWKIITTAAKDLPSFKSLSKQYTFLYPFLFEAFDLKDFDIVISSWSAWSKCVITSHKQLHISYCHTPPRFLYKYSGESQKRNSWYYKPFVAYIDMYLRVWDFFSAKRPDYIIANSQTVAKRIKKFYKIDAPVINPPVRTTVELVLPEGASRFDTNYFLIVSRLVPYKNIDVVIEAFNNLSYPLRIVGTGKEEARLKKLAKRDFAFLGKIDERELALMYQNCKGVIFPVKDEDFGIVPIEAMAHGKPVLAHRSGGVLDTIEDGKTGMFFEGDKVEDLIEAIKNFDGAIYGQQFDLNYIKNSAKKYDEAIFRNKFKTFISEKWAAKFNETLTW
ncbi:MAG: glycosyltransferase [Patescibacteria group bacterium]